MAEFPSTVTTATSAPQPDGGQSGGNSLRGLASSISLSLDISFIRSIPGILMMVEIVSGLLQWTLIASVSFAAFTVYGWVMFVAVTLWLVTSILFCLILFGVQLKLTFVPWPLTVMLYNAVAVFLCLTAFLCNAAFVHQYSWNYLLNYLQGYFGAAAFFGAVSTVAYGASAYFSYLDWKGNGGSAASGTGPS
ncbi:hypothetical protein NHX12_003018 [Muraenolepis orangiensis]|uniref:Plasmolipin n=1 Tax=Muraenolepis orangiensis TaxID=630683 RepID=A0A9Q0DVM2_9TELE|nr:hypothetical protein NHX12_003018 [Muraenolepis orangiensis]